MITTKLQISEPDYYSCELTKQFPIKVTLIAINGEVGFGINETLDSNRDTLYNYMSSLRKNPSVIHVDITYQSSFLCWTRLVHKLKKPSIYETILQNNSMNLLPIIIENGIQTHTVLSPGKNDLRILLSKLKKRFSIVSIQELSTTPLNSRSKILTKKQIRAIKLAYESGYYNIPRRKTTSELSDEIGISSVSFRERIRRAEKRLIEEYFKDIRKVKEF
ncbi:MAG: helix-turn-helix domain-containing protein [Candidatus Hodarchaeales archaeon]|jgi:predicted DNA binding protein